MSKIDFKRVNKLKKSDVEQTRQEHLEEMIEHLEKFLEKWEGAPLAVVSVNDGHIRTCIVGAGGLVDTIGLVKGLFRASKDLGEHLIKDSGAEGKRVSRQVKMALMAALED